jgi:hypothetical protein
MGSVAAKNIPTRLLNTQVDATLTAAGSCAFPLILAYRLLTPEEAGTKQRRRVHDRRNGLANMHRGATRYRDCRETRLAPRDDRRLFVVEAL